MFSFVWLTPVLFSTIVFEELLVMVVVFCLLCFVLLVCFGLVSGFFCFVLFSFSNQEVKEKATCEEGKESRG